MDAVARSGGREACGVATTIGSARLQHAAARPPAVCRKGTPMRLPGLDIPRESRLLVFIGLVD
ncbi:hypothetical protein, partial [Actinophytocola sp.]|uniref:hypothetical protein n=1 Tax=Actinophytocola sp. TaxID=1872138 RepID=UPI003D6A4E89